MCNGAREYSENISTAKCFYVYGIPKSEVDLYTALHGCPHERGVLHREVSL